MAYLICLGYPLLYDGNSSDKKTSTVMVSGAYSSSEKAHSVVESLLSDKDK